MVARSEEVDRQTVVLVEGVDDPGVFGPWEGVHFLGEGLGEDHLKLVVDLVGHGVPNLVLKPVGTPVDVVVPLVLFNLVLFAINKEVAAADSVSHPANRLV